jgi:hypothetical protein
MLKLVFFNFISLIFFLLSAFVNICLNCLVFNSFIAYIIYCLVSLFLTQFFFKEKKNHLVYSFCSLIVILRSLFILFLFILV